MSYVHTIFSRKTRHVSAAFFALVLTLLSPLAAYAAAPQDTYGWMRNIGTPAGCLENFSMPGGIFVQGNRVYITDAGNDAVYVQDLSGNPITRFGSPGAANGQFNGPNDVAIDASGNIYVTDYNNYRVQKFDSNGNYLSQFGSQGTGNGQFSYPSGIAIDGTGNIYVADFDYGTVSRIEKFDSNGNYLSQFGAWGTGNGQLEQPLGIALDSSGNIYVADAINNRIQKFDSNGVFIANFGIAGGGNGQFIDPRDITLDSAGNMYVYDTLNYRVQKLDPSGNYLGQFGSSGTGDGQFGNPGGTSAGDTGGIALDMAGNIYIADRANSRIEKFDSSFAFVSKVTVAYGLANPMQLCAPYGITRDTVGNVYVLDAARSNVKVYSPDGTLKQVFGSAGSGNGQFNSPLGLAIDSFGNIYVADTVNNRIQKFDSNGNYLSQFGSAGTGNGQMSSPTSIAMDSNGDIYVADSNNARIEKFDANGTYLSQFPVSVSGSTVVQARGVAVDAVGSIYVSPLAYTTTPSFAWTPVVQKYTSSGTLISQFGSYGTGNGQFGYGINAPVVDAAGNIYVPDLLNNRIEKFDSNGNYLSQFGSAGAGNGQMNSPWSVAIDQNGTIYVAAAGNSRISVWAPQIIPSSPQNLSQQLTSSTSAKLSWSAPASVGSLTYTYTVQYRLRGATAWTTAASNLPSIITSYTLTGLTAGTAYDIQIVAVNALGASPVASMSFVMGQDGLADTGMNTWLYASMSAFAIFGATALLWRVSRRPTMRLRR